MNFSENMLVKFFHEMRRRQVFSVLVSYAVGGWVLLQVLSIIPQAIGLPNWILTLVSVIYLAFFPVIFFVSWYFDVTSEGLKLTPSSDHNDVVNVSKKYWFGFSIMLLFSSLLGFYGYQIALSEVSKSGLNISDVKLEQSIAVLPFKDASADSNQQYLAFGIQEEISNKLGTFAGLSVASTFSSSAFFEKYMDPIVIAEKLNVSSLLTGSIRVNGDRLKVRVELLNGKTGQVIWTKSFTRQLIDIFAIEEEISRSIVNLLQDKYLTPNEVKITSKTGSSLALVLYLQARDSLRLRTTESVTQAKKLFEQSLALDSEYANAKVGLAQTFLLLAKHRNGLGVIDTAVATRLARQNLTIVMSRYPELPDVHATMGRTLAFELEHEKALPYYEQAILLNPNYATAYIWKYISLKALQKTQAAYLTLQKAYELDPAYLLVLYNYGRYQYELGNIEEASKLYGEILELHPESPLTHRGLAEIAFSQGNLLETAIQWKNALDKSPQSKSYRTSLISVLFQVQAPELAQRYIQDESWTVNKLIAAGKYSQVQEVMDQKLNENPGDKWYIYEAAWYQLLYGDINKGKDLLLKAAPLFSTTELYTSPLCDPAMEFAFAHTINQDKTRSDELLEGCKRLLAKNVQAGQKSEALDYLAARIAVLDTNYPLAISKLQSAYDLGWREHWTKNDPLLKPISQSTQVQAIYTQIDIDLATAKQGLTEHFGN
ncbi:MAG: TolB-like protein/tetratricopeptide (TPR) repeat protein [Glaciecola sp.]|jgi:TolB-like protein/tetratricopeptide (TPR) repeat protein